MPKVSPFLWFPGNMQDAVNFYVSVFKNARVVSMNPMMATFELLGQEFRAERVMQAMLKMKKIVIADLDRAYAG